MLALLSFAVLSTVACGRSSGTAGQPAALTALPSPQTPVFHVSSSPDHYLDLLGFDVAKFLNNFNSDYAAQPPVKETYLSALSKLGKGNWDGMSNSENEVLLEVSWFALMEQLKSIRYSLTESDSSGTEKTVFFEASYDAENVPDVSGLTAPVVIAIRAEPGPGNGEDGEEIDIFDISQPYSVELTRWQQSGSEWTCQRGDGGLAQQFFFPLLTPDVAFLQSHIQGTEPIEGHPAYKVEPRQGAEAMEGTPLGYWIDQDTLLPLAFEYKLDNGDVQRTVIQEVNGDVNIQPPNVNVTCQETDFGS